MSGNVGDLLCLESLDKKALPGRRPAIARALFFFLSLKVRYAANGVFFIVVFFVFSFADSSDLPVAIGKSKKISLKVLTSTTWRLFMANLLISREVWLLVQAFFYASSCFSASFFSTSIAFFI